MCKEDAVSLTPRKIISHNYTKMMQSPSLTAPPIPRVVKRHSIPAEGRLEGAASGQVIENIELVMTARATKEDY